MKKIAIIVLSSLFLLSTTGCNFNNENTNTESTSNFESAEVSNKIRYELTGGEIGKYGREITLNANTDMPAKKILYKIPAGTYKVTTTYEKLSAFWIVKDNPVNTGTEQYPEELKYVGGQHSLTAGNNNFNGMAVKEDEVTINADESINITSFSTIVFEEK